MRFKSAKMKATEGRGSIVQNDYVHPFYWVHYISDRCSIVMHRKKNCGHPKWTVLNLTILFKIDPMVLAA